MSDEATTTPEAEQAPEETPETRTFSEDQVNRIVQERLARDRRDRPSDDEIAKLREAQNRLDEIEAANASELEKAQKARDEAASEAENLRSELRNSRVSQAVLSAAAEKNIVDGVAATKLLDLSQVEFDGDGNPTNVPALLDALVEQHKFLVGTPDVPGNGGARAGASVEPKSLDEQIAEAEASGDLRTAMSLKSQKLLAARDAA